MYQNIMLPVDLNDETSWSVSLPVAVEFCKKFNAKLHVVTVVPGMAVPVGGYYEGYVPTDWLEKAIEGAKDALTKFVGEQVPAEINADPIVRDGVIYDQILATAEENNCDLILMGSHHPELKDYLLGSNAGRVVRHADCSVMVVRD